jgi:peroxidase
MKIVNRYKRPVTMTVLAMTLASASSGLAQRQTRTNDRGAQTTRTQDQEPTRQVAPQPAERTRPVRPQQTPQQPPGGDGREVDFPTEYREITGVSNNETNRLWGAADIELLRLSGIDYADGVSEPSGENRASARAISNACAWQTGSIPSTVGASDMVWQWGQFVDHDIDLTDSAVPAEAFDVLVPTGDPYFDPNSTGSEVISLNRSFYVMTDGVRQQVNSITSYIDASNVYGSDEERAYELRMLDGSGKMKTSDGDLLPFNTAGLDNAPSGQIPSFFLAGDVRANEQVGLTAMHTLFVREHNHWVDLLSEADDLLTGDQLYQMARTIVAAEIQAITYREFLPVVLGDGAIPQYQGYNPNVNPSITNVFSTAAYRFGHTLLSPELLRLDANGQTIAEGNLALAQAFFSPSRITDEGGIDPLLRGLATQSCQELDTMLVDDVRNFLFGAPGSGGFDLATLNIQRGRDHGLLSFNGVRQAYGIPPARGFRDISRDADVQSRLAEVYTNTRDMDAWVGMLAEDHVDGAMVGLTIRAVLADQFTRLRDGDRFWYENDLPRNLIEMVEEQTLAAIIRRNTDIGDELQDDVFLAP